MPMPSRRSFFTTMGSVAAATAIAPALPAQSRQHPNPSGSAGPHLHNGIFYFFGTGANDGYPSNDQVTVSDPFDKHVTRTMEALKKTLAENGCTMDSLLHLEVFLCLPLADGQPVLSGNARFHAHQAQYETLNGIYHPYFSKGRAPSRACMAVEWIPGNSLIEIAGSALVVAASPASAG